VSPLGEVLVGFFCDFNPKTKNYHHSSTSKYPSAQSLYGIHNFLVQKSLKRKYKFKMKFLCCFSAPKVRYRSHGFFRPQRLDMQTKECNPFADTIDEMYSDLVELSQHEVELEVATFALG